MKAHQKNVENINATAKKLAYKVLCESFKIIENSSITCRIMQYRLGYILSTSWSLSYKEILFFSCFPLYATFIHGAKDIVSVFVELLSGSWFVEVDFDFLEIKIFWEVWGRLKILVDLAGKTFMLHPCIQTNFLKTMEKTGILHRRFRQKIHATCKILHEVACKMEDSYDTFMQDLSQ